MNEEIRMNEEISDENDLEKVSGGNHPYSGQIVPTSDKLGIEFVFEDPVIQE